MNCACRKMADSVEPDDLKDTLECPLCYEKCEDPRGLPCQHWYCIKCLTRLIDTAHNPYNFSCPNCRVEIPIPPEMVVACLLPRETKNGRVFAYDGNFSCYLTIKVDYKDNGWIAVTDRYMYVTSSRENLVYRI